MQAQYDLILLDADDTLFDFPKAEHYAFYETMKQAGLPADEETYALYSRINDGYWRMLERGETQKSRLVIARFESLLAELGRAGDAVECNRLYVEKLGDAPFLLEHAEAVCRNLARDCTLVIATNGVSQCQHRRLERSAIRDCVARLVDSEAAGADKPDPAFFEYLMAQCGRESKRGVLMVGDSLGADIRGGNRFGLDTCWFNPHGKPVPADPAPTYEIRDLRELPGVVRGVAAVK